jgi:hypothetical protein
MRSMSFSRESWAYAAGMPNKALHRTATPLRSVAAGELWRSAASTGVCYTGYRELSLRVTFGKE